MDNLDNTDDIIRPNKRLLIIEDDERMLNNLEIICESLGHNVVHTYTRVDHFDEEHLDGIDLILSDINLPGGVSGVEFGKSIASRFPIPIIYITGNIESETFKTACESLIHGYLPKPFSKDQLDFAIRLSDIRFHYEGMLKNYYERFCKQKRLIEVGEIAGSMIHDLNNFTTSVLFSFDLIDQYSKKSLSSEDRDHLLPFVETGKKGIKRINDMAVRYRKVLRSEVDLEFRPINMSKLFDEVKFYFRNEAKHDGIRVEMECDCNLSVWSCELLLLQALVNLIKNSVYEIKEKKYSEKWIKLKAFQNEAGETIIQVSDSGTGIPEHVAAQMFAKGFSTKALTTTSGLGIGLSYVRSNIKDKLGGDLNLLHGLPNTTFEIRLPKE